MSTNSIIYDRIVKMCSGDPMQIELNSIYMAILNLHEKQEIVDFVRYYKAIYPNWKNDIAYVFTIFDDIELKRKWKQYLSEEEINIGINDILNINPITLYNHLDYIDEKFNKLPPYYNKEKGNHQSK